MEKMNMESVNLTTQNIEKIGELFPNCITETFDANGNPKKDIHFDLLRQMLSNDVVEGNESYEFAWVGKKRRLSKQINLSAKHCDRAKKKVSTGIQRKIFIINYRIKLATNIQKKHLIGYTFNNNKKRIL